MKVLILGSNGQLGTDLQVQFSSDTSVEQICLTRKDINVSDLEKIKEGLGQYECDVLINCTSYHKTDEVENNANLAFAVNSHAVQKMAEYCEEKSIRFFHISTDYVFSGDTKSPYTETSCVGPLNVYGASKVMGEQLAMQSCKSAYVLRVASLFGKAGASGKGGNFVETMIKLGKEHEELKVIDDIIMSPTSTRFIAEAICGLIDKNAIPGIYNVVNSGKVSWFGFAQEIIRLSGVDVEVLPVTNDFYPVKAVRPLFSALDNTKLEKVIGRIPTWKEELEKYLLG